MPFADPTQKVILLGRGGMLWRAWDELLRARDIDPISPGLDEFDFTQPDSIHAAIDDHVACVINCAAYTDVDGAESENELALRINGIGVGELAIACRRHGVCLVHYSTDYVFSGDAVHAWQEDDVTDPVNMYGETKRIGEEMIKVSKCDHLLIRTSWLYAPWGRNFVLTMADLTSKREEIRVVDDQRGRPTDAITLAKRTCSLLEHGARGTFHCTDDGDCTWFDLATHIGQIVNPSCHVAPCTTADFPRPAARPAFSVLDTSRADTVIGAAPHWQDRVRATLAAVNSPTHAQGASPHD